MKAFLRWIGKVIGTAVTIALVIVFFPYFSRIAARLMPDESGAAIKASAILAEKLQSSSRLETMTVDSDGVLNYDIQAAFLGSVANINVCYHYNASFGIDLQKVTLQQEGNKITFVLPSPELLQDSLTPDVVQRDDYWYPGFSDNDYEELLEDERLRCRERYLNGEYADALWQSTIDAFEQTIAPWLRSISGHLIFEYTKAISEP